MEPGIFERKIYNQLRDWKERSCGKSALLIEGMLSENYVVQALTASGHRLYFHEFYMKGDDRNLYEVDFILVKGKKIIPVESKSSKSGAHTSLDNFMEIYRKRIGKTKL